MPQRNKLPGELPSANADIHCTGGPLGIWHSKILDELLDRQCRAHEVADWLASVQREDEDWRASYLFQRWMAACIVPRLRDKGLFGSWVEVEALGFEIHPVPWGRTGFSRGARCPLCQWEGIAPSTPYLLRLAGTGEPGWTREGCRMDLGNGQPHLNDMRVHFGALPACPAPLRAFFVPLGTYGIPCSYAQNAGLSGLLRTLASQAATSPTLRKADCSIALCAP